MATRSQISTRFADADGRLTEEGRQLVAQHVDFARKLASRLKAGKGRFGDEIESIALLALVEAARRHDPARGKFSTFAYRVIQWRVADHLREEWLLKRTFDGLDSMAHFPDSGPPACNRLDACDSREFAKGQLDKLLGTVNGDQENAIRAVYLRGKNCSQAGTELETAPDVVRMRCRRGIAKMRKRAPFIGVHH